MNGWYGMRNDTWSISSWKFSGTGNAKVDEKNLRGS